VQLLQSMLLRGLCILRLRFVLASIPHAGAAEPSLRLQTVQARAVYGLLVTRNGVARSAGRRDPGLRAPLAPVDPACGTRSRRGAANRRGGEPGRGRPGDGRSGACHRRGAGGSNLLWAGSLSGCIAQGRRHHGKSENACCAASTKSAHRFQLPCRR
jgi:hypothetical protein